MKKAIKNWMKENGCLIQWQDKEIFYFNFDGGTNYRLCLFGFVILYYNSFYANRLRRLKVLCGRIKISINDKGEKTITHYRLSGKFNYSTTYRTW